MWKVLALAGLVLAICGCGTLEEFALPAERVWPAAAEYAKRRAGVTPSTREIMIGSVDPGIAPVRSRFDEQAGYIRVPLGGVLQPLLKVEINVTAVTPERTAVRIYVRQMARVGWTRVPDVETEMMGDLRAALREP